MKTRSFRFREWLLKEDPDELKSKRDASGGPIKFDTGTTFTLFEGYYIYAKEDYWVMHDTMAGHVWECRDAIKSALAGKGPMEDVDRCLRYSLGTAGRINKRALEQLMDAVRLVVEKNDGEQSGDLKSYRNRSLARHPEVVHGRIWRQHKTISFWNRSANLAAARNDIFGFMREMGANPKDYSFEVEDEMMSHDEFLSGRKAASGFDPSKIHTMLPGQEKNRAMRSMGFMLSRPVDVRDRKREGD